MQERGNRGRGAREEEEEEEGLIGEGEAGRHVCFS